MFTPTNKQLLDLLTIKESHCMNVYKKKKKTMKSNIIKRITH